VYNTCVREGNKQITLGKQYVCLAAN